MKYMVVVNQKYMISLEHDGSCGGAEHQILDNYQGIQGCQAFDQEGMKTEIFRWYLMSCQTISLDELHEMSTEYSEKWKETAEAKETMRVYEDEMNRLRGKLQIATHKYAIASNNYKLSLEGAKEYQENVMGMKD